MPCGKRRRTSKVTITFTPYKRRTTKTAKKKRRRTKQYFAFQPMN